MSKREEKREYSNRDMVKDILGYISPYRKEFWLGSLLMISASSIWLIIPWVIGEIITFSAEITENPDLGPLWNYLLIFVGTVIYYYVALELARYVLYNVSEKSAIDLQLKTLSHVTALDLHWHEKENSGSKLKRITRGGSSLNKLMRMYSDPFIDGVVGLIGVGIVFIVFNWILILILIVFFLTHYFLSFYLTRLAMDQAKEVNREEDQFYNLKFELLNSVRTIKTMGLSQSVFGFIQHQASVFLESVRKRILLFRTRLGLLGFNQQFFRIGIVAFSVFQVIEGNFEVGMIAQIFFYFARIESAANRFAEMYNSFIMSRIDMLGVNQILGEQTSVENTGTVDFQADWQKLHVRNLSFQYHEKKVLSDIEFTIQKGEKIGIIGASGEGKTTLFKLLQKLYEDYEGEIYFDQTSLRDIKRSSYAPKIGVVLQETELFNLSIRENITLGLELNEEDEKRLQRAIRIARVDEYAELLPEKLDTLIGEKGIKLSGGERQRLGLARAIFRQPEILFLDEATSHLDQDSETKIQAALDEFFEGITAIVIAHRTSTLNNMDRILKLKRGRMEVVR
ncbi:MAG: ABC transporter ATP-binding protein [Bacteroidia bacterium]